MSIAATDFKSSAGSMVPWSALDFYVKVAGKKATDEV